MATQTTHKNGKFKCSSVRRDIIPSRLTSNGKFQLNNVLSNTCAHASHPLQQRKRKPMGNVKFLHFLRARRSSTGKIIYSTCVCVCVCVDGCTRGGVWWWWLMIIARRLSSAWSARAPYVVACISHTKPRLIHLCIRKSGMCNYPNNTHTRICVPYASERLFRCGIINISSKRMRVTHL